MNVKQCFDNSEKQRKLTDGRNTFDNPHHAIHEKDSRDNNEAGANSSPHGQNGRRFADDSFRCIFVNEKFCILIKISLKFLPKGPIDNKPALVQIAALRGIGDKPLSEPMLTKFADAYMGHLGEMT